MMLSRQANSMAAPIQILICGKSSHVAIGVKEGIRPAYEALHFINSVEAGVRDLPFLLREQEPPSQGWANLGTQRYKQKVGAVVVGGGYNDADFARLREACKGKSKIPWLRHDILNEIASAQPKPSVGIEYGEQLSKQIVEVLNSLRKKNKMDEDGVYWFRANPASGDSSE